MKLKSFFVLILLLFAASVCTAQILQKVVIVTRHGVRSPTWKPEKLNQYSSEKWADFGVAPGELTAHGRKLMRQMGVYYGEIFADLLSDKGCGNAKKVYFWADTDQRTLETGRALAAGILPGCEIKINSKEAGASDALFNAVEAGIAKPNANLSLAAVRGRIGGKMNVLLEVYRPQFDLLNRILNPNGKAAKSILADAVELNREKGNIAMSGALSHASTLSENLMLEYANGMSGEQFGWGRLSAADLRQIMILHTAYSELMRRTPYLAQARGSNLLNRVLLTLEQSVKNKPTSGALGLSDSKIVFIVGHDTNISNLSGLLNLSWVLESYQPNDAPPGGALIFSLWKSTDGEFSVRVQFVTQKLEQMHKAVAPNKENPPLKANLFVPGCSAADENFSCRWSDFQRVVGNSVNPDFIEKFK
jgi:4-phytase/acid phosphatase